MFTEIFHPGQYLKDILENLNMTQKEAAMRLGFADNVLNEIINGKRSITPETAIHLETVFGGKASYWIALQSKYNELDARQKNEENLKEQIPLFDKFKDFYKDLVSMGFCDQTRDKIEKIKCLLSFFGVTSLSQINKVSEVAFRKSNKHFVSDESIAAWLRVGEKNSELLNVGVYDEKKLKSKLGELRNITKDIDTFSINLKDILSECGVKLVFVKHITHAPVSGATRWIGNVPIIQLSDRGKHFDTVVFTLFHELGHVLLHKGESFLDLESSKDIQKKELEANEFAERTIYGSDWSFINDSYGTSLKENAEKMGVHYSLLAGKIAREKHLFGAMEKYRVKVQIKK